MPNQCMGAEEEYGGQDHLLTKSQLESACLEGGYTWEPSTKCSLLPECITGCCVFQNHDGSWDHAFDVQKQSCMDSYETKFFVPFDSDTMYSSSQCDVYFRDVSFDITFDIRNANSELVDIDLEHAKLQNIETGDFCTLMTSTNPDFNYAIRDCAVGSSTQSKVPLGLYSLYVNASQTEKYSGTLNVYEDKTFEIILSEEEVQTGTLQGVITDSTSGSSIQDAKITISDTASIATSEAGGRYEITSIPVLFDTDNSPLERTVTVIKQGYNPWIGSVVIYSGIQELNVRLVPAPTSGEASYCCANDIGCANGAEPTSPDGCYAGLGKYGRECPGATPLEACNVPAPFCCASEVLCTSPSQQTGCSGVDSVPCSVPCLTATSCEEGSVTAPCICNNEIVSSGNCCHFGDVEVLSNEDSCEDISYSVTGIVIGKPRYERTIKGLSGATVFITSVTSPDRFYSTSTDTNGFFSIRLPEDEYYMIASAGGFRMSETPHYFTIAKDSSGEFRHEISEFEDPFSAISCSSNPDDDCDDFSTIYDENLWPDITPGEVNHLLYLSDRSEACSGIPSFSSVDVSAVVGKKELVLTWDIPDCQELSWFIIERCYMRIDENGNVLNDADSSCVEVAQVSASERSYYDTDVHWSSVNYASSNGKPIFEVNLTKDDIPAFERWAYNYTITQVLQGFGSASDGLIGHSKTIIMGDRLCEGKTREEQQDEFCAYSADPDLAIDLTQKLGLRSMRVKCDENNNIVPTTATSVYPVDCSEKNTADKTYSCFGPRSGNTFCSEAVACSSIDIKEAGVFGMEDSKEQCKKRSEFACVFQPDKTLVDSCVSCSEIPDCTGYTSKDSCEEDSCLVGRAGSGATRCKWLPTAFSSLGEGICLPSKIISSDHFCSEASRVNNPFARNLGWSNEFCSELGDCIASRETGCKSCDTYDTCQAYTTQEECLGTELVPISITYPSSGNTCGGLTPTKYGPDRFYNLSQDGCKNKLCSWDASTNTCFRDANANGVPDVASVGAELYSSPYSAEFDDSTFPSVTISTSSLFVSSAVEKRTIAIYGENLLLGEDVDHSSYPNWFGFKYCIDKDDVCCPDLTISTYDNVATGLFSIPVLNGLHEPPANSNVDSDGLYHLRYLVQGTNFNIAPLQSISFTVDRTPPQFTYSYQEPIIPGTNPQKTKLSILLHSTGLIPGTENPEPITCKPELKDVRGQSFDVIHGSTNEGDLVLDPVFIYEVPDGLYELRMTCYDVSGNVNATYSIQPLDRIRIDSQKGFDIISPPDMWVVGDYENVIFKVKTEVPSSCTLYQKLDSTGERIFRATLDLVPSEDQYTYAKTLPSFDNGLHKEIYDGDFEINCVENEPTCKGDPEVCITKDYTSSLLFGVDTKAPVSEVTAYGYINDTDSFVPLKKELSEDTRFVGNYFYNDNVTFTFDCYDPLLTSSTSQAKLKAGCDYKDIKYCISAGPNYECTPSTKLGDTNFPVQEYGFALCYQSVDLVDSSFNDLPGDLRNKEPKKCVNVFIDRVPPNIALQIDSEFKVGDAHITDGELVTFSGHIYDDELENYEIYMITASGYKLEEPTQITMNPDGTFTGYFEVMSDFYNAFGANKVIVTAKDIYGNSAKEQQMVFFDTLPPMIKEYRINEVPDETTVEYGKPFTLSFTLDDVFWSHELKEVSVNILANSEYNSYELGETQLTLPPVTKEFGEQDGSESSEGVVDFYTKIFGVDLGDTMNDEENEVYQAVKTFVLTMYSDDLTQDSYNNIITNLGDWKTYSLTVTPEFNEFTRLFDMGVGEYVIELTAVDVFDKRITKRYFFNVTDSTPPEIFLIDPRTESGTFPMPVTDGQYFTNNINQILEVHTGDAATCYFDFGDTPSTAHVMTPTNKYKTVHKYMLQDFEPFEKARIPFVITCSEHGSDLTAQQFVLVFDRSGLDLNVDVSTGKRPVLTTQKQIAEYQLNYANVLKGELRPQVSISDSSEKPISCSYTCKSPNSRCMSDHGNIGAPSIFEPLQTITFNLEGFMDGEKYAWGDYIYNIVCEDETGNIGKTQDVVLSVRSGSAPQQLFILDSTPNVNVESGDVTLQVVTNMMSHCDYTITAPSNLPASLAHGEMDDQPRLTHTKIINLESGTYSIDIVCTLTTDPSKQKKETLRFNVLEDPSFTSLQQIGNLPIFKILGGNSEVSATSYDITDSDVSTIVDTTIDSYNAQVVVVPEIGPNKMLHVRAIDSFGRISDERNITSVEDTVLPQKRTLDYVAAAEGSFARPLSKTQGRYVFNEQDLVVSFSFIPDPDARIYVYVDGLVFTSISDESLQASSGSYAGKLVNPSSGFHDVFIQIIHPNENMTDEYVHFTYFKNIENPKILSVSPDYMTGNELYVSVSKPSSCFVMYPSTSSKTGQAVAESPEFKTEHSFVLKDLEKPESYKNVVYVTVVCSDSVGYSTQKEHLIQIDTKNPRINTVESDNSILKTTGTAQGIENKKITLSVVRDEDAHLIVNTDEFVTCQAVNENGDIKEFDDSFLPNLHPHVALPSTNKLQTYKITCHDQAGNPSQTISVDVKKDTNAPLYIHDAKPLGPTADPYPVLEVYTYRDAKCTINVKETKEDAPGYLLFFRTMQALFQRNIELETENTGHQFRHFTTISTSGTARKPLEPGVHYTARVACDSKGLFGVAGDTYDVEFWYDGTTESRPQIYIES